MEGCGVASEGRGACAKGAHVSDGHRVAFEHITAVDVVTALAAKQLPPRCKHGLLLPLFALSARSIVHSSHHTDTPHRIVYSIKSGS